MAHVEGEGRFRSKQVFRQWSLLKVQDTWLTLCLSGKEDAAEKGDLKIKQAKVEKRNKTITLNPSKQDKTTNCQK